MSLFTDKPMALFSVTDKTGVADLARSLHELGYLLLSTGGTAKTLREAGLPVHDVSEYTGSPEILDGRVKTLHPKVHGAILFDRNNPAHVREAAGQGIGRIEIVVVNLYNFAGEARAKGLSPDDAIKHIDVGGPTMIRAAAKNWMHVLPVMDPTDYSEVADRLRAGTAADQGFRQRLAARVFKAVSEYDRMIGDYLEAGQPVAGAPQSPTALPAALTLGLTRSASLRYGENPQQSAGLYRDPAAPAGGFADVKFLQGKELSYNNILDLDAATALVSEFTDNACVIIKHTNPCGAAVQAGTAADELFRRALACDPQSAFGGIVAFNQTVDEAAAKAVASIFTECVAAPSYTAGALEVFRAKAAVRVIEAAFATRAGAVAFEQSTLSVRSVRGAFLVQEHDCGTADSREFRCVTSARPSDSMLRDMVFGMLVVKHLKSNAIVLVRDGRILGSGAGQMSRIDSARIAFQKAEAHGHDVAGAVLASDAFFPFRDTVDLAAGHRIGGIVQPGGSKRDDESIEAADRHGLVMVLTGRRHFRH